MPYFSYVLFSMIFFWKLHLALSPSLHYCLAYTGTEKLLCRSFEKVSCTWNHELLCNEVYNLHVHLIFQFKSLSEVYISFDFQGKNTPFFESLYSLKLCTWNNGFPCCYENPVGDKYHVLITCSAYKVIREKCDNLLDMHDNVNVMLKGQPRRMSTCVCVCALFSNREFFTTKY